MTETTEADRSQMRSRRRPSAAPLGRRFFLICACIALALGAIVGGYLVGLDLARRDVAAARELIDQLQPENLRLKRQVVDLNSQLAAAQSSLTRSQNTLKSIMPTENTFNINPNQSMIVANGQLTVGLIGSPTNDSVRININGKQQSAASGDIIHIALDPSTACQVGVQSFDMFKAVLTATCATVKTR